MYKTIIREDKSRKWHLIDASGITFGKISSLTARLLRGKHKTHFSFNFDNGDYVVIVNASKVLLTGNKVMQKKYRHTGYPGGIKSTSIGNLVENNPYDLFYKSIRAMMPKNKISHTQLSRVFVYKDGHHPHIGQKPELVSESDF